MAELCKARFPCIYLQTWEEERVLEELVALAADAQTIRTPRAVFTWAATTGVTSSDGRVMPDTVRPHDALRWAGRQEEPCLFVFKDLHVHFGGAGRTGDAMVVRGVRDLLQRIRRAASPQNLVLVSPVLVLPDELQKDVTVTEFELPTEDEIRAVLDQMIAVNERHGRIEIDLDAEAKERLTKAALGLTLLEAENAFARAMVADGRLDAADVDIVLEEKRQVIRKTEILEFIRPHETFDDIGGLQNLKTWLVRRNRFWRDAAAAYGLPHPKGLLITGVPGCGKSLTAKCTSTLWQLPLLRLDIGRIFAGLVGSSEQNMRNALQTAEAISPCILWIDEIEKGFSGTGPGAGDSGTASRVFGTFLTWMQEKDRPVFVIATANAIDALPPEFLRKGRFDEIFFCDLPTQREREKILQVHLRRRLDRSRGAGELVITDERVAELAAASEGHNGAELEQALISGLFEAFAEDRPVGWADFARAIQTTVPLSVTQAEQIRAVRAWANVRAVAATAADDRREYATGGDDDGGGDVVGARGGRAIDF